MSVAPRILVAGIGNIFLADDAFGVRVVELLRTRSLTSAVKVVDFGIRGFDLAYALLEPWDAAVLIDAISGGDQPGTIYLIEPECDGPLGADDDASAMGGHSLDPASVLRLVRTLGGTPPRIVILGCEPSPIDPAEDIRVELSTAVAAAVPVAASMVESIVQKLLYNPLTQELTHDSTRPLLRA